jgi:hypothetical protein
MTLALAITAVELDRIIEEYTDDAIPASGAGRRELVRDARATAKRRAPSLRQPPGATTAAAAAPVHCLALLRHVRGRWVPARRGEWRAGQRGSQRAMARAIASRMVVKLSAK